MRGGGESGYCFLHLGNGSICATAFKLKWVIQNCSGGFMNRVRRWRGRGGTSGGHNVCELVALMLTVGQIRLLGEQSFGEKWVRVSAGNNGAGGMSGCHLGATQPHKASAR